MEKKSQEVRGEAGPPTFFFSPLRFRAPPMLLETKRLLRRLVKR